MPNAVCGLLVLNKPPGPSSREAIDHVARLLPRVKVGHAGTLDPMASGVLVACLGKATRLIPFVQRMKKEYQTVVRFGQRSDTHDLEGRVEDVPFSGSVDRESLEACLSRFRGEIMQVPPQHSAVHVSGRRAYELARSGRTAELAPRPVRIDRLECVRLEWPHAELEIRCSSGTYVRSLVRDMGDALGCGAVMTQLVRTAVGPFRFEEALKPSELTQSNLLGSVRPARAAVVELASVVVEPQQFDHVRHGRNIALPECSPALEAGGEVALCDPSGELLAVATCETGRLLQPRIVLIAG